MAALCNTGIALLHLGQVRPSIRWLERALAISDEVGALVPLTNLAGAYESAGDLTRAAQVCERARPLLRQSGRHQGEVVALIMTLSELYTALGDHQQAHDHAARALDLASETGHTLAVAQAHELLAASCVGLGSPRDALKHTRRALATQRSAGQRLAQARTLLTAGHAQQRLRRDHLARARWREAHALFTEIGAPERETTAAVLLLDS